MKPWKNLKDVLDSIGKVHKSLKQLPVKKRLPAGLIKRRRSELYQAVDLIK